MIHPKFTARPLYHSGRDLHPRDLREQASRARASGHYNMRTLWLQKACWQTTGKASDLLALLLLRRDFGYPLVGHWLQRAMTLYQRWSTWPDALPCPVLNRQERRALHNLVHEARLRSYGDNWAQHCQPAAPDAWKPRLTYWQSHQQTWWQQFRQRLQQAERIHVVGNSACLLGQRLGHLIDDADLVIRFNQCMSDNTPVQDVGTAMHIWAVAPGYRGPVPQQSLSFALATGPDMLFRQQRFDNLRGLEARVLSIPLHAWRPLARRFAAPPSAGALVLNLILQELLAAPADHGLKVAPRQAATLSAQAGSQYAREAPELARKVRCFGFGPWPGAGCAESEQATSRYHVMLPKHQATGRHHWQAEAVWCRDELAPLWQTA